VLLIVVASAMTYRLVENPFRRSKLLASRTALSLAIGVLLVALTIFLAQWQIALHYGDWNIFA
jgi:peptidoglycan/LPS O-acetylase OafA/YrhL